MKSILAFTFFVVLSQPLLAENTCPQSVESCEFYSCLENQYHCSDKGYPLHFGKRNCEKYLRDEARASNDIKSWFPKVRLCLQQYLAEVIDSDHRPADCDELKVVAFQSHVECYVSTGYCSLGFWDKLELAEYMASSLLTRSSFDAAREIDRICSRR